MRRWWLFFLCWLLMGGVVEAKDFFVAVNGNDSNLGTIDQPLLTFDGARLKVREYRQGGGKETVTVNFRNGIFRLTSPVVFDENDSGEKEAPTVYKNYENETAIISGGMEVKNWVKEGSVWKANLSGNVPDFRQLYVNGQRRTRARSNDGKMFGSVTGRGFKLIDAGVGSWGNLGRVEIVGNREWKQYRCGIEKIEGGEVVLKSPCFDNSQNHKGTGFDFTFNKVSWVENAKELMDSPGEWYWDLGKKALYYYPMAGEEINKVTVVVPVVEKLVWNKAGVDKPLKYVKFLGLTLSEATSVQANKDGWCEVQANYIQTGGVYKTPWDGGVTRPEANIDLGVVEGVEFRNCKVVRMGGAGVSLAEGSKNNLVANNIIGDISGNGLMVGGIENPNTSEEKWKTIGNVVKNNSITRVGQEYAGAVALFLGYSKQSWVSNNTIFNIPYTGISIGWGWGSKDPTYAGDNVVEKNLIYDHVKVMRDGGGIYSLSAQPGNIYRKNVIVGQINEFGAVYLDEKSRYITVENNVIFNNKRTMLLNATGDNVIKDNWWQERYEGDVKDSAYKNFGPNVMSGNLIINNLSEVPETILGGAGKPVELKIPAEVKPGKMTIAWVPIDGVDKYALRIDDQSNPWKCNGVDASGDVCVEVGGSSYEYEFKEGRKYNLWVQPMYKVTGGVAGPAASISFKVAGGVVNTPTIEPSKVPTKTVTATMTPIVPTNIPTKQIGGKVGDANGDETVNLVDFSLWKREYLNKLVEKADFNGDGVVDLVDFSFWKREYLKN